MPIDQRMTGPRLTDLLRRRGQLGTGDPDWAKLPPEDPNASDAPIDLQDTSGEHNGGGAEDGHVKRRDPRTGEWETISEPRVA